MSNAGKRLLVLDSRLVDDLYVDALVLADEARAYLESDAGSGCNLPDPFDRVQFSCESLKITTRLMQVIAWLLTRRAVARGEISDLESRTEKYRLGDASSSDPRHARIFPDEMRTIIAASQSLYLRARRLEEQRMDRLDMGQLPVSSPARELRLLLENRL